MASIRMPPAPLYSLHKPCSTCPNGGTELAGKERRIQDVTYQTDQQTLILNTATAYFRVLSAIDALSYTEAQKQAVYRRMNQTTQRFNVGTVAITDVQNARSQYDTVLANEVTARNNLDNARSTASGHR